MDHYQLIAGNFQETIEAIAMSVDDLAEPIERSAQKMTTALLNDRKLIACGNGADGALAQLFVNNLLDCFELERPALPALSLVSDATSLTAIATSNSLNDIFSRQIHALGQEGDILLCISSGESHGNLHRAIQAALDRNMEVIALSNTGNGKLSTILRAQDVELQISAQRRPRIIELQTMTIQCLCELIEHSLFGSYNQE